jgi:hypothetical protein
MNREEIIRMAREANIKQAIETPHLLMVHELERFAALVAAAEREACAQIAKDWDASHPHTNYGACISNVIRARSKPCG